MPKGDNNFIVLVPDTQCADVVLIISFVSRIVFSSEVLYNQLIVEVKPSKEKQKLNSIIGTE